MVVRITPEQPTHGAIVRNLLDTFNVPDFVNLCDFWGQPSMHTKDLVVNSCRKWELIEKLSGVLPYINTAIFLQTLLLKPLDLGDLPTLVVAAYQTDPVGLPYLHAEQQ